MYEIMVEVDFSAAHRVREIGGRCESLHGHTYKVQVFLEGKDLNAVGMLVDFREVKRKVKKWVDKLDHTYLNESLKDINPTAENLARYLFERLQEEINCKGVRLSKVRVAEAEDAWASYSGEED